MQGFSRGPFETSVRQIFIAPQAGAPMQELDSVHVTAGLGIDGDRYANGFGQFQMSGPEERRLAVRHLSLIAYEDIAAQQASEGEDVFFAAETRRNIVTQGLILEALVGDRFKLGDVAVRGIELCLPCPRPGNLVDKSGFRSQFPGAKGGLRVAALTSGNISVNDSVSLETMDQVKRARRS